MADFRGRASPDSPLLSAESPDGMWIEVRATRSPRSGVSAESPMVEISDSARRRNPAYWAGSLMSPPIPVFSLRGGPIGRVPACRFGPCRTVGITGLSVESPIQVAPEPYLGRVPGAGHRLGAAAQVRPVIGRIPNRSTSRALYVSVNVSVISSVESPRRATRRLGFVAIRKALIAPQYIRRQISRRSTTIRSQANRSLRSRTLDPAPHGTPRVDER
jgi:hypothetical protein